jgi:hypothetical protein
MLTFSSIYLARNQSKHNTSRPSSSLPDIKIMAALGVWSLMLVNLLYITVVSTG